MDDVRYTKFLPEAEGINNKKWVPVLYNFNTIDVSSLKVGDRVSPIGQHEYFRVRKELEHKGLALTDVVIVKCGWFDCLVEDLQEARKKDYKPLNEWGYKNNA